MRLCWQVFAVAMIFFCNSVGRRAVRQADKFSLERDFNLEESFNTDLWASMSGKCSTLKVAGRDFACKTVAFFHAEQGRNQIHRCSRRSD